MRRARRIVCSAATARIKRRLQLSKQATMQKPQTTPAPSVASKKRNPALLYSATGAAVLIIALAIWGFAKGSSGPPRLNENAVVLSKFVSSKDYDKLPFEQQRQYMKILDDREKEID